MKNIPKTIYLHPGDFGNYKDFNDYDGEICWGTKRNTKNDIKYVRYNSKQLPEGDIVDILLKYQKTQTAETIASLIKKAMDKKK